MTEAQKQLRKRAEIVANEPNWRIAPQTTKRIAQIIAKEMPRLLERVDELERENKRLQSYERSWVADHYGEVAGQQVKEDGK